MNERSFVIGVVLGGVLCPAVDFCLGKLFGLENQFYVFLFFIIFGIIMLFWDSNKVVDD